MRLAVLLVFAWMFRTVLTGEIYVTDDLLNYHFPVRQFYSQCLQNGDSFDWMPSLFSGFYLSGTGQAGTYHPFHWLLYRFLSLNTAFNLEILSSYPFLFFGMLLFLRRHQMREEAVWLGAISFTFCGFCSLHFLHPNAIAVVAHLPWLLLCLDCVLTRRTKRGARVMAEAGVAVLTASQILLGYPQYVWYSAVAEIVYCLVISKWTSSWARAVAWLALLKFVGILLGAIQLLPSIEALNESERTGMTAESFGLFPLSPLDFLQFIGPYLTESRVFGQNTHELGAYGGAVPILLMVIALVQFREFWRGRPLFRFCLVLAVLAIWLSTGRSGGLYRIQTALPLIGKFRWPSRIVVLIHFAIAGLAATGLDALLRSQQTGAQARFLRRLWIIPATSVAASLGTWLFLKSPSPAPLPLLIAGPVLLGLAVLLLREGRNAASTASLLLFALGDLAAYGFTYEALSNVQSVATVMASLKEPPGPPESGRVLAEAHGPTAVEGFGGNDLLLAGWHQADGYEGLIPQICLPDENMSSGALRQMGVRWVTNAPAHRQIAGLVPSTDVNWLECRDPADRFRMVSDLIVEPDTLKAARMVGMGKENQVIVSESVTVGTTEPGSAETFHVIEDRPGLIRLQVSASVPRLMTINERFSAGWVAVIDGSPTRILRANADYMAFVVPEGQHDVSLRFAPAGLLTGRRVTQSAIILLVLFGLVRNRQVSLTGSEKRLPAPN